MGFAVPNLGPPKVLYFLYYMHMNRNRSAGVSQELPQKIPIQKPCIHIRSNSCNIARKKKNGLTTSCTCFLRTFTGSLITKHPTLRQIQAKKTKKWNPLFAYQNPTVCNRMSSLVERRPWYYIANTWSNEVNMPWQSSSQVPGCPKCVAWKWPPSSCSHIQSPSLVASTSVHLIRILTARHIDWYSSEPLCLCWQFLDFSCTTNR